MVDVRWMVVVVASLVVTGCWSAGQVRFRDNPDLTSVKLATGDKQALAGVDQLGVVRTAVRAHGSCDDLVTQAMRELLAESRALGGSGVRDVKFRQRWHWSGRETLCRRQALPPYRLVVEAQGVAVK
jgi:hypothetical protein